jgi:lactoylglutathione lyase/glyoxylase I family protein
MDDISARLAFFRDPWGNLFELSERMVAGSHPH